MKTDYSALALYSVKSRNKKMAFCTLNCVVWKKIKSLSGNQMQPWSYNTQNACINPLNLRTVVCIRFIPSPDSEY